MNRWFNGVTTSVNRVKISIAIGPTTKMVSGIRLKNFGWATKTFTCLPTMKITRCESNLRISKAINGKNSLERKFPFSLYLQKSWAVLYWPVAYAFCSFIFVVCCRYAQYSHFKIYSEADYYKLEIDGYEGNAGDSLNDPWYGSNNSPFSTYNRDNDRSSLNCASMLKVMQWFGGFVLFFLFNILLCWKFQVWNLSATAKMTNYIYCTIWNMFFAWKFKTSFINRKKRVFHYVNRVAGGGNRVAVA